MCYGTTFPSWQAWAVRHLLKIPEVEIALLIEDVTHKVLGAASGEAAQASRPDARPTPAQKSRLKAMYWGLRERSKTWRLPRKALWRSYLWLSNHLNNPQCDAQADLSAELGGVPVRRCRVRRHGHSEYFSNQDIETIRTHELDVILRFAFNIIRGEILEVPRYGVWSFHHDDHMKYRGSPPGFWEIFHNDPWNGAILQRLTDKLDDGVVIHHDRFPTLAHSYSANRNQAYMGSAAWPANACRAILAGLEERVFMRLPKSNAPIFKPPSNKEMLTYLPRLAGRKFKRALARLRPRPRLPEHNWNIGIIPEPVDSLMFRNTPLDVNWLKPEPGTFLADPFLVEKDGMHYIFVEEFVHATGKGHISVIETRDWVNFSRPSKVLEQSYHLSYPCAFEHEGRYYCVPEQHQSGRVVLYEIQDFPFAWIERATLLENCPGVDPTLFRHAGRWWMHLTREDHEAESALFLYYADDLFGPWQAHPANPVSTTRYRLRPAGPLFTWNGKLLRPAQDGRKGYGSSLIMHEVLAMTPSEYEERFFDEMAPRPYWPYPDGLHTMASLGPVTVIDANWLQSRHRE